MLLLLLLTSITQSSQIFYELVAEGEHSIAVDPTVDFFRLNFLCNVPNASGSFIQFNIEEGEWEIAFTERGADVDWGFAPYFGSNFVICRARDTGVSMTLSRSSSNSKTISFSATNFQDYTFQWLPDEYTIRENGPFAFTVGWREDSINVVTPGYLVTQFFRQNGWPSGKWIEHSTPASISHLDSGPFMFVKKVDSQAEDFRLENGNSSNGNDSDCEVFNAEEIEKNREITVPFSESAHELCLLFTCPSSRVSINFLTAGWVYGSERLSKSFHQCSYFETRITVTSLGTQTPPQPLQFELVPLPSSMLPPPNMDFEASPFLVRSKNVVGVGNMRYFAVRLGATGQSINFTTPGWQMVDRGSGRVIQRTPFSFFSWEDEYDPYDASMLTFIGTNDDEQEPSSYFEYETSSVIQVQDQPLFDYTLLEAGNVLSVPVTTPRFLLKLLCPERRVVVFETTDWVLVDANRTTPANILCDGDMAIHIRREVLRGVADNRGFKFSVKDAMPSPALVYSYSGLYPEKYSLPVIADRFTVSISCEEDRNVEISSVNFKVEASVGGPNVTVDTPGIVSCKQANVLNLAVEPSATVLSPFTFSVMLPSQCYEKSCIVITPPVNLLTPGPTVAPTAPKVAPTAFKNREDDDSPTVLILVVMSLVLSACAVGMAAYLMLAYGNARSTEKKSDEWLSTARQHLSPQ